MESVLQYKIPVLHPLAVHFPIALLLVGAAAALLWMIWGHTFWQRMALMLHALGFAGSLFAYFTGEAMEEQAEGVPMVDELVGLHEQMALYTVIMAGVTTLAFIGTVLYTLWRRPATDRTPEPFWIRLALALLAIGTTLLVAWTSHIGSTMVWGVPGS